MYIHSYQPFATPSAHLGKLHLNRRQKHPERAKGQLNTKKTMAKKVL
jgi:hypothetical protein